MDTALIDWLSLSSLTWSLLRVAIVWLAFYGTGSLILRNELIKKHFHLMPLVIPGMLLYMGMIVVLSLFHLLTRRIVPVFVILGAFTGLVLLYIQLKKYFSNFKFSIKHPLIILPFLLAGYILITNLMLAGRPEMNFNDTQVTYLVQPDRWLNDGHISFLDETRFSAYPMTSEMLLLLPSSLADNRLDQMIVGQLFEYSMVIALVVFAMIILGFAWKWFPAAMISIAGCSTILLWCHFAKPDGTALFFVTISLTILLKQITAKNNRYDLSAFLVMGLALTSKFTAYITLIPFILMLFILMRRSFNKRFLITGTTLLIIIPLIFVVRTIIHTGTPFYPHAPFSFLLNSEWRMPEIHLTYSVFNDRTSHFFPDIGFFQNIYHFFGIWNSSIFLLIAGYLSTVKKQYIKGSTLILVGFGIYSVICMFLFYPAWWGAKYGILLIPFAAFFGFSMLRKLKYGFIIATALTALIYFIYDTSISPTEHYGLQFRNNLIASYTSNSWKSSSLQAFEEQPELKATLWMNSHLPENSTILSFYVTKRYFSNHRWIIAWRYPVAMQLYLSNSIEDEIVILQELGIDYIINIETDPAPFDDEKSVELFSRIGRGDVLEPVANIDGHTICKFCPSNL